MQDTVEVFIHGLESSAQGTKGRYFRALRPKMIIEDYSGPFTERMEKLEEQLAGKKNIVVVGSSYGGLMAAVFALRHPDRAIKLILLAPALHLMEFLPYRNAKSLVPTIIYQGKNDTVVPPEEVRDIASQVFLHLSYHLVDDDHALNKVFPTLNWNELLTP